MSADARLGWAPSGATRVAAVIGSPVAHSRSPAIHNAAFAALGLDWVYVAFDVAPGRGGDAVGAMRSLGLGGLSVTMPHKADVARAVDGLAPAAAALGAVNTVVRAADGRLIGHSTDGDGFVDSLRAGGIDPAGMRVTVLGAGGAARSVVVALAAAGARDVAVVNRTTGRAAEVAALAVGVGRLGTAADVASADLVVNATSVGMGADGSLPVDPTMLSARQVVADLVYQPLDTPLLRAARAAGAVAVGGLGMLVHQAGRQLTLWTGCEAPLAVMDAAARAAPAVPRA